MNTIDQPTNADLRHGMAVEIPPTGQSLEPGRELLQSCSTYAEAQAIVDRLSDADFQVERMAIVARDLAFYEQVTGKLTWGRALIAGIASGAMIGFFIGLFFGMFLLNPVAWGSILLWSTVVGAILNGTLALLSYLSTGGKRDFSSVGAMKAGHYDVLVASDVAEKARQMLQ